MNLTLTAFVGLLAEQAPSALLCYSLGWLMVRSRGGQRVAQSALWHSAGFTATALGATLLQLMAIATFGGNAVLHPASDLEKALHLVPTALAAIGVCVFLRVQAATGKSQSVSQPFDVQPQQPVAHARSASETTQPRPQALLWLLAGGAMVVVVAVVNMNPSQTTSASRVSPLPAPFTYPASVEARLFERPDFVGEKITPVPALPAGLKLLTDEDLLGHAYVRAKEAEDAVERSKYAEYVVAAERFDADAQFRLYRIYDKGNGVPQDRVKAFSLLWASATGSCGDAMSQLAWLYESGDDVGKDLEKARAWYERAAQKGNALAQLRLAVFSNNGLGGPRNYTDGLAWAKAAAEQGGTSAQALLGSMYADGVGTEVNKVQAYKWFDLAAGGGHNDAQKHLAKLESEMNREDIAAAQRAATSWSASNASKNQ